MSQLAVNSITDTNSGNTATINGMTPTADSLQGFRNRIINGDMRIDQRNAGAAVTANGSYAVDRFRLNQNVGSWSWQQDSSAPAGFVKSSKVTVTSSATPGSAAVASYSHQIEGTNVADLGFGTANAKTVTCSFWVRSSVTGSYGIQFANSANDRSYVDSYSISTADTWEYKTITISGDTAGTWLNDTGVGLRVRWDLGGGSGTKTTAGSWVTGSFSGGATGTLSLVETNGATWYITGVQLEVGSVATPFERRPYGMELSLCQRYYSNFSSPENYIYIAQASSATTAKTQAIPFKVSMRVAPTITLAPAGNGSGQISFLQANNGYATVGSNAAEWITTEHFFIQGTLYSGTSWSIGTATSMYVTGTATVWQASAEL